MASHRALALTLGLVLQIGGSLSTEVQDVQASTDDNMTYKEMIPMAARACNVLSFGLYKAIASDHDNVVLSPFSMCSLLAVCMDGARGKTLSQLKNKMILKLSFKTEITKIYGSVFKSFDEDEHVNITTSNVMLVNKHLELMKETADDFRNAYRGVVNTFDPEVKDMTAARMNALASSATEGLVEGDLEADDFSADTALYLSNALKLSARWKDVFKIEDTGPMKFYLNETNYVKTDTMYRRGEYRWQKSKNLKCDVIEIPYEGDRFAMYILLPFERTGLKDLEETLVGKRRIKLEEVLSTMEDARTTDLYLPKFTISQSLSLKKPLRANKITALFSSKKADLSDLVKGGKVFIKEAIQKATIDVMEEGTIAGTVTYMMGMEYSAYPVFKATHPFLYVLRDRQTNFNIFFGKYSKP